MAPKAAVGAVCVGLAVLYYVTRSDSFTWALQDGLCALLGIFIIKCVCYNLRTQLAVAAPIAGG